MVEVLDGNPNKFSAATVFPPEMFKGTHIKEEYRQWLLSERESSPTHVEPRKVLQIIDEKKGQFARILSTDQDLAQCAHCNFKMTRKAEH